MLPSPFRNLPAPRVNLLLGVGLFVAALVYRLIGIGWGLPNDLHNQSYHPDEQVILSYSQQVDPLKGDFDPGFYNYGTLYLTVLRVATDMAATYGTAIDEKDPSSVYRFMHDAHIAGRIISALAGAGTVALLFFMLRRFTSTLGAFLGAFLVLVAPAHVVHSRFQTPDVVATFLLAVATYYALKLLPLTAREGEEAEPVEEPPVVRLAIWSGLFAGLSGGTKYTGILGLLTLYVALAQTKRPGWWKAALAGTGTALAAFVIATPGALLNTSKFMQDLQYEMAHTAQGHGLTFEGVGSGFTYHLYNLTLGVGLFLTVLALGGLAIGVKRKQPWVWPVLAFFIPYFILIGRAEVMFIRYTFPLYIGLAFGFGWLMGYAHERKGGFTAIAVVGIAALVGLDPLGGFRRSAIMTTWMAGTDSRDEAALYLKDLATKEPDMAVGLVRDPWFWSPPLFKNATAPRWQTKEMLEEMQQATAPKVVRYIAADGSRSDWDIRLLTETKPKYIAISSFDWEEGWRLAGKRGLSPAGQVAADQSKAFFDRLTKDYAPDREFGKPSTLVHDLEYIRPTIWIWKRKDTPEAAKPPSG